jgi:FkbM family methyltransferase
MDQRILFRKLAFSKPVLPVTNRMIRFLTHAITVLRNEVVDPRYNGEHWLVDSLRAPRLVIDAGYNTGDFSERVLSRYPDAVVHAFDPAPQAAEQARLRHGGRTTFHFHPVALSNAPGQAPFFDYGNLNGCSSLVERRLDFADGVTPAVATVATDTLDRIARELGLGTIDLLKLDVEGFEPHALEGAKDLLRKQQIAVVLFEYASGWLASGRHLKDTVTFLRDHGYDVYRLFLGFLSPFAGSIVHEGRAYGMFVALPHGAERYLPIRQVEI